MMMTTWENKKIPTTEMLPLHLEGLLFDLVSSALPPLLLAVAVYAQHCTHQTC